MSLEEHLFCTALEELRKERNIRSECGVEVASRDKKSIHIQKKRQDIHLPTAAAPPPKTALPAATGLHSVDPGASATVLSIHFLQSEEIVLPVFVEAFPGGQLVQSVLDDAPVADE